MQQSTNMGVKSTADVVIIGGGVVGAAAAFHLGRRGAGKVVVLEAGEICSGETRRSGGFIQTHWASRDEVRLIHRSLGIFQNWEDEVGGDCYFEETGYLHVTGPANEAKVREVHQMLLAEGFESHWLTPDEIKELEPELNVEGLVGGAYEPRSGWADPVATTRSLMDAAVESGAQVKEETPALQIQHNGSKVQGVVTPDGLIECPVVLLAAGPRTQRLHPDPRASLPILVRRGQVFYTDRPRGLPGKGLCFYDETTGMYTHPMNRMMNLVGIDWSFDFVYDADNYDTQVDADYVQAGLQALSLRYPGLAEATFMRGFTGLYDFTPDGHPMIGRAGNLEGYYLAAGFSGAGFKYAYSTGLGLAEFILDGHAHTVNLDAFSWERFDVRSDQPA